MKKDCILPLLPYVMARTARRGSVLDAVLDSMEAMHEPSEHVLRDLDSFFDPARSPDRFLPMLARWVGLERVLAAQEAGRDTAGLTATSLRLRDLVSRCAELTRWRGTQRGLAAFLEIATGVCGFVVAEGGQDPSAPRPFHITVTVPAEAARQRRFVERIVQLEKPAHVTCDIFVAQQGES